MLLLQTGGSRDMNFFKPVSLTYETFQLQEHGIYKTFQTNNAAQLHAKADVQSRQVYANSWTKLPFIWEGIFPCFGKKNSTTQF